MERIILNLDYEWRFHRGDIALQKTNSHTDSYSSCKSGAVVGPAGKIWNDVDWRIVDLPHDYYAESDFSEENLLSHGYRSRCNAWYRKSFLLDESLADRELFICFEGTAVNAEFYFNGLFSWFPNYPGHFFGASRMRSFVNISWKSIRTPPFSKASSMISSLLSV